VKVIFLKQYSTLISIKQLTFQKKSKHSHNTRRPKTMKNVTTASV